MKKASLAIFSSEPASNTGPMSREEKCPAETPAKSDSGKSSRPRGRKRSGVERVRIVVKLRKDLVDEYDLEARRRWPDKERMRSDLIEQAMERWSSVGFPRQRYQPEDWRKKREEEEREAMRDE